MSVPAIAAQNTLNAAEEISTEVALTQTKTEAPAEVTPKIETKPEETSKTPEVKAEIKYSLKLPEGSLLDASRVEEVVAFAKASGLSNEHAQGILDRESKAVNGYVESQKQSLKTQSDAWVTELQADQEIGGKDFVHNAELASRVIRRFGDETLINGLNETGLGNHPSLVRAFVRIGKLMSEDQLVPAPNPVLGNKKSLAEKLYDHPTSKE